MKSGDAWPHSYLLSRISDGVVWMLKPEHRDLWPWLIWIMMSALEETTRA